MSCGRSIPTADGALQKLGLLRSLLSVSRSAKMMRKDHVPLLAGQELQRGLALLNVMSALITIHWMVETLPGGLRRGWRAFA